MEILGKIFMGQTILLHKKLFRGRIYHVGNQLVIYLY